MTRGSPRIERQSIASAIAGGNAPRMSAAAWAGVANASLNSASCGWSVTAAHRSTTAAACRRTPHTISMACAVAGGPAFAPCEPGRVAGIMIHGTLDEVVAFELGVTARDDLLERNACAQTTAPTEPEPCVAYDGCDAGYDVHWCEHSDPAFQGHWWPDWAAGAIWSFFAGLAPE